MKSTVIPVHCIGIRKIEMIERTITHILWSCMIDPISSELSTSPVATASLSVDATNLKASKIRPFTGRTIICSRLKFPSSSSCLSSLAVTRIGDRSHCICLPLHSHSVKKRTPKTLMDWSNVIQRNYFSERVFSSFTWYMEIESTQSMMGRFPCPAEPSWLTRRHCAENPGLWAVNPKFEYAPAHGPFYFVWGCTRNGDPSKDRACFQNSPCSVKIYLLGPQYLFLLFCFIFSY